MNPVNEVRQIALVVNDVKCDEIGCLEGIAIDTETDTIYVSYWRGDRIIVYNKQLEEQVYSEDKFYVIRPQGLRFKYGLLYVLESKGCHCCVKLFRRDGTLLKELGSWRLNAPFKYTLALDVDADQNMYVCNAQYGNILILSKEGKLMFIGKFGKCNLFFWPIDIRIQKTLIYVLSFRNPYFKNPLMFVFDLEHNFVTEFCLPMKGGAPRYFVINSYDELIFSYKNSAELVKVNGHTSYILEYPHCDVTNAGRKGIEIDSEGRIVSVLCASLESNCFLQVTEYP